MVIDTCNCSQPIIKGTIDLADPNYCTHPEPVQKIRRVAYKLHTKNKDPITWSGFTCTQWLSQKEISTNFLLAHDTIFRKTVSKVSQDECWATVRYPQLCNNNVMVKDGKTYRYIREPEGEGSWLTTQRYTEKNCVSQEIQLAKECHDCPVTSPFGILTNSSKDEVAYHNDLTIVWKAPDAKEPTCDIKIVYENFGNFTKGKTQGKLEDHASQLEFLFETNQTKLCSNATVSPVLGLPETYIEIVELTSKKKRSYEGERENDKQGYLITAANPDFCLTFNQTELIISACTTNINLTSEEQFEVSVESGQNFQFLPSGFIGKTETSFCLNSFKTNNIGLMQCQSTTSNSSITADKWLINFDTNDKNEIIPFQIILTTTNTCLTAKNNQTSNISLQPCVRENSEQHWIFEQSKSERNLLEYASPYERIGFVRKPIEFIPHTITDEQKLNSEPVKFYGQLKSKLHPNYCLSVPSWGKTKLHFCHKAGDRKQNPLQELALLRNGFLRVQGNITCITPGYVISCLAIQHPPVTWEYSRQTKLLVLTNYALCLSSNLANNHTVEMKACDERSPEQHWEFEHSTVEPPSPLEDSLVIRQLKKRKEKRMKTGARPRATAETRPTAPPPDVSGLADSVSALLLTENKQYIEGQAHKHENQLSNEIRQLYCKITMLQRNQAVMLSQSSGLLAARALNLDKCSRIVGNGQSLVLQICEIVPVNVTAKETKCGFQPYFRTSTNIDFTVGKDGWSLHPFHECFWSGQFINLNDQTFSWVNGDWVKQEPVVHVLKLKLIKQFDELPLKSFDYLPRHHSMYESSNLEQLNVLTELVSRVQQSNTNSLSDLVLNVQSKSDLWDMTSWMSIFKYGILIIGISIAVIFLLWIIVTFVPFSRLKTIFQRKPNQFENDQMLPMLQMNSIPIQRSQNVNNHDHSDTMFIPGQGLYWKDMCPIKPVV